MNKFFLLLCCMQIVFMQANAKHNAPVRGTWITNVASDALHSEENVIKTVAQCKAAGLNHVFVVVWNNGSTIYPSKVVEQYTGVPASQAFDPLRSIIKHAHKNGIKVHAWFEFGFSYAYNDTNSVWLKRYPAWAGRKADGSLLQKNKFYWWSSLNPDVQKFLTRLVLEVVEQYDIDGVQGDDRLPAMPAEGGYDAYTQNLYADEHNGAALPANARDKDFIQWKADKLSAYGKQLYHAVKSKNKQCMVSWAPSIYPWSKEEYLQDWPAWLNGDYADLVIPQLYRYDINAYENVLKQLNAQVSKKQKRKVFPGILTSLGDGYQATPELIKQMIALNRQYGFKGEVFFYYETLNRINPSIYK